jgi:hypothetical protein
MPDNSTVSSPTPQTVPTVASPELALLAVNGLRAELNIKFDSIHATLNAMEKAVTLQHDDLVRVPTDVQKTTSALRELMEAKQLFIDGKLDKIAEVFTEKISGMTSVVTERIKSLADVTTQQFKSIEDKFAEKDKAVSVGLSAQKESAAAQQSSNMDAQTKMESNFTKLLDQGRELLGEVRRNTELQINDIKSRLDKGEGKTSVTDPAVGAALMELSQGIKSLNQSNGTHLVPPPKPNDAWAYVLGAAVLAVGIVIAVALIFARHQ